MKREKDIGNEFIKDIDLLITTFQQVKTLLKDSPDWEKDIALDALKHNSDDFEFLKSINRISYGLMNLHNDFKIYGKSRVD